MPLLTPRVMRSLLATTMLGILTTPAAQAVDVKMYGTVNKAYMGYSDGQTTESNIVDNNNESTRIGMGGEQKLDNGATASVLFEAQQTSNPSNEITQNTATGQSATPLSNTPAFAERIARVGLANDYGAIFLGQQDVATDDAFTHDLAAATSVLNGNVASFGGGLAFRTGNGTVANLGGTDLTVDTFALGNDGNLDAADSIRFNSATYNGFNGSLSTSQGGNVDANIRYADTLGDFQIDSALGHKFVNDQDSAPSDQTTGVTLASVSVKHSSGLAASLSYEQEDLAHKSAGVDDPTAYYGKVGYAWDAFGVAAEYGKFKNPVAVAANQTMNVYGVGGEYDLGHGVTAGALYRNLSADVAGISNIEDINVWAVAMRVKF